MAVRHGTGSLPPSVFELIYRPRVPILEAAGTQHIGAIRPVERGSRTAAVRAGATKQAMSTRALILSPLVVYPAFLAVVAAPEAYGWPWSAPARKLPKPASSISSNESDAAANLSTLVVPVSLSPRNADADRRLARLMAETLQPYLGRPLFAWLLSQQQGPALEREIDDLAISHLQSGAIDPAMLRPIANWIALDFVLFSQVTQYDQPWVDTEKVTRIGMEITLYDARSGAQLTRAKHTDLYKHRGSSSVFDTAEAQIVADLAALAAPAIREEAARLRARLASPADTPTTTSAAATSPAAKANVPQPPAARPPRSAGGKQTPYAAAPSAARSVGVEPSWDRDAPAPETRLNLKERDQAAQRSAPRRETLEAAVELHGKRIAELERRSERLERELANKETDTTVPLRRALDDLASQQAALERKLAQMEQERQDNIPAPTPTPNTTAPTATAQPDPASSNKRPAPRRTRAAKTSR